MSVSLRKKGRAAHGLFETEGIKEKFERVEAQEEALKKEMNAAERECKLIRGNKPQIRVRTQAER